MKIVYSVLSLSLLFVGCQPKPDYEAAIETFEINSQTVLDNVEDFQNENRDYSQYASGFVMRSTEFGTRDTLWLEDMMKSDKELWANYDFKLAADSIYLLPGVNEDTRMLDGSVRHYTDWRVTRSATDSTEEKSAVIKLYESFDFNAEGEIIFQQVYGDFTGLFTYLNSEGEAEEE